MWQKKKRGLERHAVGGSIGSLIMSHRDCGRFLLCELNSFYAKQRERVQRCSNLDGDARASSGS